ncbi:MAG: trypsin-like peptidase domain-containing protein [Candidatus Micrarchaeota archaeon]
MAMRTAMGRDLGKSFKIRDRFSIGDGIKGKSRAALVAAAMAAAVFIAAIGFIVAAESGIFAKGSALALQADVEPQNCTGTASLSAELRDSDGQRVPDALIRLYAGNDLLDSLYTDRNGMVRTEVPLHPSWCGRGIGFRAEFAGNARAKAASAGKNAIVRAPVALSLEAPGSAPEGEEFVVRAGLTNAATGMPLAGKQVSLGTLVLLTGANGTAEFLVAFNESGEETLRAVFAGDDFLEPGESETVVVAIEPPACDGGIPVGACAGRYMCNEELELEFDCQSCGCGDGRMCIEGACVTENERIQMLIARLQKSNVKVMSDGGIGSGVIIGKNGSDMLVLTNRHVVDPDFARIANGNIEIINFSEEVSRPRRILIAPNQLDMAVLVVGEEIGPPAVVYEGEKPKTGAEVVVLGSPLGIPNSASKGIISNFVLTNTSGGFDYEVIQTDAAVNPGSSGGGLFLSSDGRLIGITSFKLTITRSQLAEGLGFAIPVTLISDFPLDEWTAIPPS